MSDSPKQTIYQEAMQIFHQAADLISLDHRVRLELDEPDYEHIFYVTARLQDRLVLVRKEDEDRYANLPDSQIEIEGNVEPLYDGSCILAPRALRRGSVHT